MENVIKQMYFGEGGLAGSSSSLPPIRLGLCDEGSESGRSRTPPMPGLAFGTAPGLEPRSSTPGLAPTMGADQVRWPMALGGWTPAGQRVGPPPSPLTSGKPSPRGAL